MSTYPFDQPQEEPLSQSSRGSVWEQQPFEGSVYGPEQHPSVTPMIDVVELPEELRVFVDLPGYDADEISIRGHDNTVVVSAARPLREEGEEGTVVVHERPTRLERTIQLPSSVDARDAEASYEDGVCTVTLPKESAERFEEIPVK